MADVNLNIGSFSGATTLGGAINATPESAVKQIQKSINNTKKIVSKLGDNSSATAATFSQLPKLGPKTKAVTEKIKKQGMFDELWTFTKDVYADFKKGAHRIWSGMKTAMAAAIDMMYNVIMAIYQAFKEAIRALGAMFKWIWDKLVELKNYIMETIKSIWASIKNWWNDKGTDAAKDVKETTDQAKANAPKGDAAASIFESHLEKSYQNFLEAEDPDAGKYQANMAAKASMIKKAFTVLGVSLVCLLGGYFIYRQSKQSGRSAIIEATNTSLRSNYLLNEIETGNVVLEGAFQNVMGAISWPFKSAYPKAIKGLVTASQEKSVPAILYVLWGAVAFTYIVLSIFFIRLMFK